MELTDLEQFAFGADRATALASLIPGSEDHYHYHCLDLHHRKQFKEAATLLTEWRKRHGETEAYTTLERRQLLLAGKPAEIVSKLRDILEPDFNHQREAESRAAVHPTKLDQKHIARAVLAKIANDRHSDLSGYTDHALDWLAEEKLDDSRLRHLLQRLTRPDHPQLVALILRNLADTSYAERFGNLTIHRHLLLEQLDQLARKRPELLKEEAFVHCYLGKMRPNAESTWDEPGSERQQYLDRLWAFVLPLAPSFNSLKAHVLYHRLELDRAQGVYDSKRFLTYLKLPRQASYMDSDFLHRPENRDHPASLGKDFRTHTGLAVVRDDETLVSDFLANLLKDTADTKAFAGLVRADYLKQLFAITKMLHGIGKQELWYDHLAGSEVQALKERVDLEFAPTNRTTYRAVDPVSLELDVKNVTTLVVKVFEINTFTYYQAQAREIDGSLDLDGLVASDEQTHTYTEAPLRRVRRSFTFPALNRAGVFVVEFIGNGKSSRAVIRKGGMHLLERVGAAGHVFSLVDEDAGLLKDATLWLGGREFRPDDHGAITVPFTAEPTTAKVILRHGSRAALNTFQHQSETYRFDAGLFVEREHLLKRRQAQVLVRPSLTLHGVEISPTLLEDVRLSVTSTDHAGVDALKEFPGFALTADRESVATIQVPENLARLTVALRARVRGATDGKVMELSDERTWSLNGIDATEHLDDLHLARTDAGHVLYLLGKSGEPRPGMHINVTLTHRDFTDVFELRLQSDAQGRVELGALADITEVRAANPNGQEARWSLTTDTCIQPTVLHARVGTTLRVPYLGAQTKLSRTVASLLTLTHGTYVSDASDVLALRDGFIEAKGLPAGDHELLLRESGARIQVHVTPAPALTTAAGAYAISARRVLELRERAPLHVELSATKAEVMITVTGASRHARVHLCATRFLPAHSLFDALRPALATTPRLGEVSPATSLHLSGRDIGDEYRYILDRRLAAKYPGNLLTRPGLLLNPWAVRATETSLDQIGGGGAYAAGRAKGRGGAGSAVQAQPREMAADLAHANLDFLANSAHVLTNLVPDKDGIMRIPRADLAHANHVRVVVLDRDQAVRRDLALPEVGTAHEDLRLRDGLDPLGHFTEQQQATLLTNGQALELADITTAKIESVDTLPKLFALYTTLSDENQTLAKFAFITTWPELSDEQKRAKYSEFAGHELSFFLMRKDPAFFHGVIKPYLRNKRELTFLDRFLLGDDLTAYRAPWSYGRLNAVERILLSARDPGTRPGIVRDLSDRCDLIPPDLERDQLLFQTVLGGSALDSDDAMGFGAAKDAAKADMMAAAEPLMDMMMESSASMAGAAPAPTAPPACAAPMPQKSAMKKEARRSRAMAEESAEECERDDEGGAGEDLKRREQVRQFFRKLDRTQEWAENHYWHLHYDEMGPELVEPNAFWNDYAKYLAAHPFSADAPPFLSQHLALPTSSFTEMMFALAVLDLPFVAATPAVVFHGARMRLTAGGPQVAFHQEIRSATPGTQPTALLMTQHYFRRDDRSTYEGNEEVDKYVVGEFLTHVVYLCQVVATNPTSTRQRLDLLLQIPRGAIPVANGLITKGTRVDLEPYGTTRLEYAFYFPGLGSYAHSPVHAAKNGTLVAHGAAGRLTVVREPTLIDRTSWAYISQHGDADEVLTFLNRHNLQRLDLDQLAWRLRDAKFFSRLTALLAERRLYHDTTWSYGLLHSDTVRLREWLSHQEDFLTACGPWLDSPLVTTDAVALGWYQHLEYAPLVNARAHRLGSQRTILNQALATQYRAFLQQACYRDDQRSESSHDELLSATYYLLLQDRVAEGLAMLKRVDRARITSHLQYDYLSAYAAFFSAEPQKARAIATPHRDHPVDRWRTLFRTVLAQLDETTGSNAAVVDPKSATERQAHLAASEASIDVAVEAGRLALNYRGVDTCRVNYYLMDIELLFSRQPFVHSQAERFSFITPTSTSDVTLPSGKNLHHVDLPTAYRSANTVIEVVAGGRRTAKAHYAHALDVQVSEAYGQVRIGRVDASGQSKPLPTVYVKAYARIQGGEVRFFKDGYTDLRGRFDYASLSTDELDRVERFALLIMSTEHGALIREATPPQQ